MYGRMPVSRAAAAGELGTGSSMSAVTVVLGAIVVFGATVVLGAAVVSGVMVVPADAMVVAVVVVVPSATTGAATARMNAITIAGRPNFAGIQASVGAERALGKIWRFAAATFGRSVGLGEGDHGGHRVAIDELDVGESIRHR